MILAIHNLQDVIPTLVAGLQNLEEEYGQSDWLGFVSSGDMIRQISGAVQPLSSWLPEYPIGSAIMSSMTGAKPVPQWCQNEKQALVFMGSLENAKEIRAYLWDLGYDFQEKTDKEIVHQFLNRYLALGNSPLDALKLTFKRLHGRFAIMTLFAQPEQKLIVSSKGYSLGMGMLSNSLIIGSDIPMLKRLSPSVMVLEEDNPVVLSSV
jgi:glucosamine--fructose-6-phosphate aminotransferase (isomerizing)